VRRLSEGCSGTCSQPVGGTVCPCVCPWPRDRERCANRCGMGKGGGEACECIPFLAAVGSERHSLWAGPRVAHGIQARSPPLEEISVSCSSFSKARAFHVVGAQLLCPLSLAALLLGRLRVRVLLLTEWAGPLPP